MGDTPPGLQHHEMSKSIVDGGFTFIAVLV
jgi:hypothetical protein